MCLEFMGNKCFHAKSKQQHSWSMNCLNLASSAVVAIKIEKKARCSLFIHFPSNRGDICFTCLESKPLNLKFQILKQRPLMTYTFQCTNTCLRVVYTLNLLVINAQNCKNSYRKLIIATIELLSIVNHSQHYLYNKWNKLLRDKFFLNSHRNTACSSGNWIEWKSYQMDVC